MKKTLYHMYQNITYNLKTLIYFEVLYHAIGLLLVFPIARLLLYTSVRLSGYTYITNQLFLQHIFNPSTMLILFLLLVFLSLYIVIEMIFLSLIYDFGYHEESIGLKDLLILGLKRCYVTFKKYHLFIIFPAFLFFFMVQLIHLAGIYSTISLPDQIAGQLNRLSFIKWGMFAIGLILIVLFFETTYSLNLYTIDQISIKKTRHQSRLMLKKNRLKMILEFIVVNVFLNILFYGIYLLIIVLIGLFVYITKDQSYVLGVLLTLMYAIYAFVGLIASAFLIPINFALLSTWYYDKKEQLGLKTKRIRITDKDRKAFNFKTLKRVTASILLVLFVLNISSIVSLIRQDRVQIELFNYAEVIAHRGASFDAPENTLSAIELAIEQGSDAIEIDVGETIDRHPILIHDATTGRTTNDSLNQNVNELTLSQIQSFDAGSWFSNEYQNEQIPSLVEALQLIKGKAHAFIELKSLSLTLENQTVRIIEQNQMVEETVILSFNRDQLNRIKNLNSDIKTLLLVPFFYGDINVLLDYDSIDYYGFSQDIVSQNPEYVYLAHQNQKSIYVWTINDEEELKESVANDVDGYHHR
jgi:glycerophosphoryl diester phosphodiesterase